MPRRDPFANQKDLSRRPVCVTCMNMCIYNTAWKNPATGKVEIRCSRPDKADLK